MKQVLSIDFDYFLDTDIHTRNIKFPDGVDEKPKEDLLKEWEYFYNTYPEIRKIGVIKEFENVCDNLRHWLPSCVDYNDVKCFIADSHKMIEEVFKDNLTVNEDFEITHIDFHHDNYISGGNTLDCANWVRILKERKPNSIINWLRREDSETASLMGEFPYEHTTAIHMNYYYDYIFICFSPEWTPPHLKEEFDKLCKSVERFNPIYL